jgi:phosphate:Na+ symporter
MTAFLLIPMGLLIFLGGLRLMTMGLEQLGGSSFAHFISRATGNRFFAFFCGIIFTALTQSSSLATVMVVGAVDAGLLGLGAAVAVIIGANVGTTVTGQMLSFNLHALALPMAVSGLLLLAFFPPGNLKTAGRALTGLGTLLFGLKTMGSALAPLSQEAWFDSVLYAAEINPLLGILLGAVATAILQSSSALMGMVLALAHGAGISLAAGASLVVGADVGTCITSLLAGLGAGLAAKRAALAHLFFNIISVMLVLPMFRHFILLASTTAETVPRQLANAHTLYNLSGAVVLLILLNPYILLLERITQPQNTGKKRTFSFIVELLARWF